MSEIIYDEEDGRIGCCWVKTEQNIWIRRNSTVACDSCRKKRIRCTSSIYGAPCPACIKAQISCHIPQCGDPFSFSDKPIFVFRNIYPAPAAPISTTLNNVSKYQLDLQAVNARILVSGNRPAPLIWKSIEPVALTSKKRKGESTPIQQTKRRGIDDIKAPSNAIAKNTLIKLENSNGMKLLEPKKDVVKEPQICQTRLQFVVLPPIQTTYNLVSSYSYPSPPYSNSISNWSDHYKISSVRDTPQLSIQSPTLRKALSPFNMDSFPSTPQSIRRNIVEPSRIERAKNQW